MRLVGLEKEINLVKEKVIGRDVIGKYIDLQDELKDKIEIDGVETNLAIDIMETMNRLDRIIRKQKSYKKQLAAYHTAIQLFEEFKDELKEFTR
jgi:hypothetical protein